MPGGWWIVQAVPDSWRQWRWQSSGLFICSSSYDVSFTSLIKRVLTCFPFLLGIVIKKIDRVYLGSDLQLLWTKLLFFLSTLNVYISSSVCSVYEITVFHFISLTVFGMLLSCVIWVYGIGCIVSSFVPLAVSVFGCSFILKGSPAFRVIKLYWPHYF